MSDNYSTETSRTLYTPDGSNQHARLWSREKLLHDFADLGVVESFEGTGDNPTGLTGYSLDKLWLRPSSAGVSQSSGTVRAYAGGDASLLASWPVVTRSSFAGHIGARGGDVDLVWSTATSGDPGAGKILVNHATLTSATQINISKTGRQGQSYASRLASWDDSTNSADRGQMSIYTVANAGGYLEVKLTGAFTDQTTYVTAPVTVTAAGSLTNGALVGVSFARTGNAGSNSLDAHWNVEDYGVLPDGSDNSTPLASLLSTVYAAGGGTLVFGAGVYRVDSQITLPYDGSAVAPKGVPIRLLGAGAWHSGRSTASAANGGTIIDCRYAGANAWLMCLHEGTFSAQHITFSQRGTAHTTPYIFTSNTVLQISECSFEGHATKAAATANQDCIILGGTSNASFGGNGTDQPFQGYGTVIERCNFNRIRRGVYGRVYANGVVVQNNNFWAQCGGASAIEFDSGIVSEYCVGGMISGNLIECVGYVSPIRLNYCSTITLVGNNFYDNGSTVTPSYIYMTNCTQMVITGAVGNDGLDPYINDASQCAFYLSADSIGPCVFKYIESGRNGYPNLFGETVFVGGAGRTVVQPEVANGAGTIFEIKRSAAEGANPNANTWSVNNQGGISWGNASATQQGNMTTTLSSATSWSNNGRTWACNAAGGAMTQDSGTGGSSYTAKNAVFIMTTNAGAEYGRFSNAAWSLNGVQVLTTRRTGWGAPTGTATRTTFDTASVTLEELARRVKALIDDATTHGLIGT